MTEINPYADGKKIDRPKAAAKARKPPSANKISVTLLYEHNADDLEYCMREIPNHYRLNIEAPATVVLRMALHKLRLDIESGDKKTLQMIEELHNKNR